MKPPPPFCSRLWPDFSLTNSTHSALQMDRLESSEASGTNALVTHTLHRLSSMHGYRTRRSHRGFTLLELMTVVVIIGILAALAIYSVRGYIQSAKTVEAREIIASIKAGQEAYFDETFKYLTVTADLSTYYPSDNLDGRIKVQWGAEGCADCLTHFKTLGVTVASPVMFRYAAVAGATGLSSFDLGTPGVQRPPFAAAPAGAFYVVKAVSDLDGQGAPITTMLSSNFSAEIYTENEGK